MNDAPEVNETVPVATDSNVPDIPPEAPPLVQYLLKELDGNSVRFTGVNLRLDSNGLTVSDMNGTFLAHYKNYVSIALIP